MKLFHETDYFVYNESVTKPIKVLILSDLHYSDLIKRPEISYENIYELIKNNNQLNIFDSIDDVLDILYEVEILLKYDGYISKAKSQALKMSSLEMRLIPDDINYNDVHNLALEAREKLSEIRPKSIGQASRIMGVNPADIAVLSVYIEGIYYGSKK